MEGADYFHPLATHRGWIDALDVLLAPPAEVADALADARPRELADVVLELPLVPARIWCVGLNYHDHRAESASAAGEHPTIFTRTVASLVAPGEPLERPRASQVFDYEGELAVVIGRAGRAIPVGAALDHVAGYSCFQDGSIRDYQRHTSQFTAGKNFDRTGSFGPWLATLDELDRATAELTTVLSGEVVQRAPLSDMIHSVEELIAYCSTFATLLPGDVIATGTPGGVGIACTPPLLLQPGDVVEVSITGLGTLTNPVVDERAG